jgi:hypothetical protein
MERFLNPGRLSVPFVLLQYVFHHCHSGTCWKLDTFVLTLIPKYDINKSQFLTKKSMDIPRVSSKRVDLRDAFVT